MQSKGAGLGDCKSWASLPENEEEARIGRYVGESVLHKGKVIGREGRVVGQGGVQRRAVAVHVVHALSR